MKTHIFLAAFMLVLPTHLTGITTTHHDKSEKAQPSDQLEAEELSPASTGRINITERQRRLIPYMTFYLTRNLNRPSNQLQELREPPQQFQVVPQKVTIQPYHGKIFLVNSNQQKYEQQNNQPILVYQPKTTYTPFMESNKLPGGFTPIRNPAQVQQPIRVQVINPNVQHQIQPNQHQSLTTKEPNYSLIFDKLLQLKQMQYNKPPQYMPVQLQPPERPERQKINVAAQYFRNYATPRPPTKYITLENYPPEQEYKPAPVLKTQPTKYVTLDYPSEQGRPEIRYKTPTPIKTAPKYITIAAPIKAPPKFITLENYQSAEQERYKTPTTPTKTYIHTYTPANIDISNENKIQNYENFESLKTYNQIPAPEKPEFEATPVVQQVQQIQQVQQVQQIQQVQPVQQIPQVQEIEYTKTNNYETPTPKPILLRPIYQTYQPVYEQEAATIPPPTYTATENPHSLSVILKQLQDSNTLPQTLTPDNIDNSIKTLVHILNALKQTQKFQRPIVVTSEGQQENLDDYEDDEDDGDIPETVSQSYPAETPEGGTPGKPGIDYPAHSFIPQTNFNCKKQRYKGFFGDPDTNCQVWHYCDLNGGQASFLCPNGTIFSQVALTCDWWYNVKCATTTQLYVLNERLYKYILPFTPKFPEDYSGPLVDRYLALKFKEMEEKMKKQKKGKTEKPADDVQDSEVNTLQDLETEAIAESQKQEQTTQISRQQENSNK